MTDIMQIGAVALGMVAVFSAPLQARDALLAAKSAKELTAAFQLGDGWTVDGDTLVGESPEYHSLPESDCADFPDDAWTYFTVHPINLWRYALAGNAGWRNYTLECAICIEKPAPLKGVRPGVTFFNYQWGREAIGSDAGILVRYRGPDDYYMVRLSSGYGHVELWKTHGGVVRVKPLTFEPGREYRVAVTVAGRWITVAIDGNEILRYWDPVEPINAGKIGLAVRESRARFSAIQVRKAAANTVSPPPHSPDFRRREWVGRDYIFDGDEPIAWFGWMAERGLELREVKLRPGLMPLVSPHCGVELYNYTTGGVLSVTGEGRTFDFNVKLGRTNEYEVNSRWQIAYEPERGYVLDKRIRFAVLKDKAVGNLPPVEDLYFYQLVAPHTDKLPKCRQEPNWCIAECDDGKIVAFPNANYVWNNGLGDPRKSLIRPDGAFASTIDGWAVACQFPADNTKRFFSEQCHWGLDAHMGALGPAPVTGEVYEAHIRIALWDKTRTAAAIKRGVLPEPARSGPAELFALVEPINRMATVYPGLTGESVRLWTGKYAIDRTRGRGDRMCMRIDAKEIRKREADTRADERPNIWLGPSYWTGPYLAKRYRFGMHVRADQFRGTVALLADGYVHPKNIKLPEVKAELPINGKTGWTYVSFEADFPRQCFNWALRIDAVGEGVVWVDDMDITPLK